MQSSAKSRLVGSNPRACYSILDELKDRQLRVMRVCLSLNFCKIRQSTKVYPS
jgi:hypothetical protein